MRRETAAPEMELIEVDQQTTLQIYTEGDVNGLLDDVKRKVMESTPDNPDLSIKKIRDIFRTNAASVARAKTKFDGAGKGLTEDWKAKAKKVDSVRKFFRDSMDYFKAEYRQPLTEWEAEEERKEIEAAKLAEYLADWDQAISDHDFFKREKEVQRKEAEFAKIEEERLKQVAADNLAKEQKRLQDEAAENAKLEAEQKAEREKEKILKQKAKAQADRDDAKRKLKEEEQKRKDGTAKAEREKREAAERAEKEKAEAIAETERQAEVAANRKEDKRLEIERIEREKAEKKAANIKHQKKINNEALADLVQALGVEDNFGMGIIKVIAKGQISNISINY